MIRDATEQDSGTVAELAVASGLFPADDVSLVVQMMEDYVGGNAERGHRCVLDEEDGQSVGVAYYAPKEGTEGTWALILIAVRQSHQGQGRGSVLLRHVEERLVAEQQRLLLVETAGTPDFERTRQFYVECGYERVAQVRDYYADGVDMVLFRKALRAG